MGHGLPSGAEFGEGHCVVMSGVRSAETKGRDGGGDGAGTELARGSRQPPRDGRPGDGKAGRCFVAHVPALAGRGGLFQTPAQPSLPTAAHRSAPGFTQCWQVRGPAAGVNAAWEVGVMDLEQAGSVHGNQKEATSEVKGVLAKPT